VSTPGPIAVLGGGPAGASAALRLARGGAEVDLYLPAWPGEKPCGGAVPEHVLPHLAGFDPSLLPAVVAPAALLVNGSRGRLDTRLGGIRIFRRSDLDGALVAAALAAGAHRRPLKAERLELPGDRVRVIAGGEAREYAWVVAADGARSLARRTLGTEPAGESIGLGATLSGLAQELLVLALPEIADSYLWVFPRPGGASVGIAYTDGALSHGAARAALDRFLDLHLPAAWRQLPGPRYRYPIPVYGPWTGPAVRRALTSRLLLAGDAAALADPLTREGIRYGMLSGLWAAEHLLAGEPAVYAERLEAELDAEMARAHRARTLFFEGPIGQWMIPVARWHAGIRGVLSDLLACRLPYRGLRQRLLRAAVSLRPSPSLGMPAEP
jgi:flavin-dependent dehydrogenase